MGRKPIFLNKKTSKLRKFFWGSHKFLSENMNEKRDKMLNPREPDGALDRIAHLDEDLSFLEH